MHSVTETRWNQKETQKVIKARAQQKKTARQEAQKLEYRSFGLPIHRIGGRTRRTARAIFVVCSIYILCRLSRCSYRVKHVPECKPQSLAPYFSASLCKWANLSERAGCIYSYLTECLSGNCCFPTTLPRQCQSWKLTVFRRRIRCVQRECVPSGFFQVGKSGQFCEPWDVVTGKSSFLFWNLMFCTIFSYGGSLMNWFMIVPNHVSFHEENLCLIELVYTNCYGAVSSVPYDERDP